mmetsp:Transcript_55514/g.156250  ORF Transcript_55514/g.156250 Transcript_55514/m.156250 type:complete len:280 (-) Transcript_55514:130-969(-)
MTKSTVSLSAVISSLLKLRVPGSSSLRITTVVRGSLNCGLISSPVLCRLSAKSSSATSRSKSSTMNVSTGSQVSLSMMGTSMTCSITCGLNTSTPSTCSYRTPAFAVTGYVQYLICTLDSRGRVATTGSCTTPAHSRTTCRRSVKPYIGQLLSPSWPLIKFISMLLPLPVRLRVTPCRYWAMEGLLTICTCWSVALSPPASMSCLMFEWLIILPNFEFNRSLASSNASLGTSQDFFRKDFLSAAKATTSSSGKKARVRTASHRSTLSGVITLSTSRSQK